MGALLEAIDDPTLTVGLSVAPMIVKQETGEIAELLRWSQTAIDLADGDPTMGDFVFGSPLALALIFRGIAKCWLGLAGWQKDFRDSLEMARTTDRLTYSKCVVYKHSVATLQGVLLPDDSTLAEVEEALSIATDHGDHHAVALATYCLGGVLLERGSGDRRRGRHFLAAIREMSDRGHFYRSELAVLDLFHARELARDGHLDVAVDELRAAADSVFQSGQFAHGVIATESSSRRCCSAAERADVQEADAAIDRLASAGRDDLAVVELVVLRLRALAARARGDDVTCRQSLGRCRERRRPWASRATSRTLSSDSPRLRSRAARSPGRDPGPSRAGRGADAAGPSTGRAAPRDREGGDAPRTRRSRPAGASRAVPSPRRPGR